MRADAGVELQPQALAGRQQRQHRVGRGGGGQRHPPLLGGPLERRQRVAAGRVEQLQRLPVARQLPLAGRPALGRDLRDVGFAAADPPLDQELAQPLRHPRVLELVGEHRRHRHRQPRGDLQHRQVGADHRVEQPLLAERVGPEALDVGHVGVEDDRQVADALARLSRRPPHAVRQTARKSSARRDSPS